MTLERSHPFPILNEAREAVQFNIPRGVAVETCGICRQPIVDRDDALVYQRVKEQAAMAAHRQCAQDDLTSVLKCVSRYGVRGLRVVRR